MRIPNPISWKVFPTVERWLNQLLAHAKSCEIKSGQGYKVNRTTQGTSLVILPGTPGSSAERLPFQVYQSGVLKISIKGGRIIQNGIASDIDDISLGNANEITVAANVTTLIWLEVANEFATTLVAANYSYGSDPSGWTAYPDQESPPAVKYILLAEVEAGASDITAVTLRYHGGDVFWPSVFGFWA